MSTSTPDVSRVKRVQVIAHRGASQQLPENTVEAFRRARELGADAVELDVRCTRDGSLVVHHDPQLPDGRDVAEIDRDALPASIPTLEEALDACHGMWVNIEVKNDPSETGFDPSERVALAVATLLSSRIEPLDQWLVSSFRRETIDAIRAAAPSVPTAWLCIEVADAVPRELATAGHEAIHPWFSTTTAEVIRTCHDAGLRVNVWTCDDPDQMIELIAAGVDGICTNRPDVARQVVDTGNTRRTASGT